MIIVTGYFVAVTLLFPLLLSAFFLSLFMNERYKSSKSDMLDTNQVSDNTPNISSKIINMNVQFKI